MYRRSTNRTSPPPYEIIPVVKHYAPTEARFYRLRNLDSGDLLPPEGKPARICAEHLVESPEALPVGTWQILYYRAALDTASEVPPAHGDRPPTVVYGADGVLLTPADWERTEEAKNLHLERRDLSVRRETALTRTIEAQGSAMERMSSHLIERDGAIAETLVSVNKLQIEMLGFMREMINQGKASTDAQSEALVTAAKRIAEATNTLKTDNLASVGIELIKQTSTIVQAFAPSRQAGAALKESKPRSLEREPTGPAAKLPPLPPPEKAKPKPPEDPPPPARQAGRDLPSEIVIAWDDLFNADGSPPAERAASPEAAETAPAHVADAEPAPPLATVTDETATGTSETTTPSPAALADLPPALSQLLGMMGLAPPVVRPRPAVWSPAWAVRQIKERIASLSEVSIAWLLSSWKNALGFLRELADLARPPDPALLAEQGSSP